MNKMLSAVLVSMVVAGLVTGENPIAKFYEAEAPTLNIDVQLRPVEHDPIQLLERLRPGMYRASVLVEADPGSRVVIGTEDIILSPGQTKSSHFEHEDVALSFVVELGEKAAFAKTSVTVTRAEKVIGRQVSTVWLARPTGTIVPVEPAP